MPSQFRFFISFFNSLIFLEAAFASDKLPILSATMDGQENNASSISIPFLSTANDSILFFRLLAALCAAAMLEQAAFVSVTEMVSRFPDGAQPVATSNVAIKMRRIKNSCLLACENWREVGDITSFEILVSISAVSIWKYFQLAFLTFNSLLRGLEAETNFG